jgi:hypothetical protein
MPKITLANRVENRLNIFSQLRFGKKPCEIFRALKNTNQNAPSLRTVYRWVKNIQNSRQYLNDLPRIGHPVSKKTQKNINLVNTMLVDNPNITLKQIKHNTDISIGCLHQIICDGGAKKKCSKYIFDNHWTYSKSNLNPPTFTIFVYSNIENQQIVSITVNKKKHGYHIQNITEDARYLKLVVFDGVIIIDKQLLEYKCIPIDMNNNNCEILYKKNVLTCNTK